MALAAQQWSPTSVQVAVLQARGLRAKGKTGTNDAYAVMQVGKDKFQTSVVEKTVAPVWKEEASFDLQPLAPQGGGGKSGTLHVHVLHRALVGPDKLLGQAVIDLLQLSEDKTRNKTEWFKLLNKTGKVDKDRGEVLLDIQFTRNNMTASMFDLSSAGKSRSRLGKFKDKVRGKKKEQDSSSVVVPSFSQVLTDSEEEGASGGGEEGGSRDGKPKQHKKMSLFSSKSNLQRNMSQSMSVLPGKNSSLSGSQSSGLNMESSEGKKKFKFKIHKHSSSSDAKDSSSGKQKQDQSNLCINGSHVYCEEPPPRTSRTGSSFSLSSSGRGSMEDVPENSSPSMDSLREVKEYSPWMEEEEEEEEDKDENTADLGKEEEEKAKLEKDARKEEESIRKQQKEPERLVEKELRLDKEGKVMEEGKGQQRLKEQKMRLEEQERRKLEEEGKKCREEKERAQERRRQEEEDELAEEKRRLKLEQERIIEQDRVRREQERADEERREMEQEKRQREEEEKASREKEHARLMAEKRLEEKIEAEEKFRKAEEEKIKMEEDIKRKEHNEKLANRRELEEQERRRKEQDKKQREQEERLRQEEMERLAEQKLRLEEDRRRAEEEQAKKDEEDRIQKVKVRREEEEEQSRQLKDLEKLALEKLRQEEEERKKAEEEQAKRDEEDRIHKEKVRREEEEEQRRKLKDLEKLALEKLRQEEEERKKAEEEQAKRDEEDRIHKERRKEEKEQKRRQQELEKLAMERLKEEERRKAEEEQAKRDEEDRIQKEKLRRAQEEEQERRQERLALERLRQEEEEKKEAEEKDKIQKEKMKQEEENARKAMMEEEMRLKRKEQERIRDEKQRVEELEKIRLEEEEESVRREEKVERERREGGEGRQKTLVKENKMKEEPKSARTKLKLRVPAEITSTNPFDENFTFPDKATNTPKAKSDDQSVQLEASSVESGAIFKGEKDLIDTRWEKRAAPNPPGGNQTVRQIQNEEETAIQLMSQINKQIKDRDVKTVSVAPQRSVQMIAPMNRSCKDMVNNQSLTEHDSSKEVTTKHGKRPAPSIPCGAEDELQKGVLEMKEDRDVYGLNPFEDDETEINAHDDSTSCVKTDLVRWPPVKSQAGDKDLAKIKSSKNARAPLPPNPTETPPSFISKMHDGSDVSDIVGTTYQNKACNPGEDVRDPVQVQESPKKESKQIGTLAGAKEEGPSAGLRRLQPVKPLNPLKQQSDSSVNVGNDKSTGLDFNGVQQKTNGHPQVGTGRPGQYSQLTREELIALLLKQESQLSDRDKKISELEQYIDNLLVRVMEESPSILISMSSLKKAA